jgi:putative heme-binding domain-containing protein
MKTTRAVASTSLILAGAALHGQAPQTPVQTVGGLQLRALPGFVVERINPPDKTDSYVVITFDANGQPVAAKEGNFVFRLIDADGDGMYESERPVSEAFRNCQGVWFDGPAMYGNCIPVMSDEARAELAGRISGRLQSQTPLQGNVIRSGGGGGGRGGAPQHSAFVKATLNAEGYAESVEIVTQQLGGVGDHGPHAIRRGPDGTIMVMRGNNGGTMFNEDVDPDSLILNDREAQFLPTLGEGGGSQRDGVHSALWRFHPDTRKHEVVLGGNRNTYDFAFNLLGEVFYHDSDHEPEMGVPWYRRIRSVHGIPGGNYGYRNSSGKYPEYYLDSLPPMRDLNRGSPTGVETYQSYAYPREFFDNLLEDDWSRGRLLYTALTPSGATYRAREDQAEFLHGEPLNMADLEVGPDGNIYFVTGGRSSYGGVFRIRYVGQVPPPPAMTGILAVVRQPQPLSSWGWANIERIKLQMGAAFGTELERIARDTSADVWDRVRGLYELHRHGGAVPGALLRTLIGDRQQPVRAAAVYVAGLSTGADARAVVTTALEDGDALVRRRALEAVVRMGQAPDRPTLVPVDAIYALLSDGDRLVRWSARIALERTRRSDWADRVLAETNATGVMEGMLAWVRTANGASLEPVLEKQVGLLMNTRLGAEDRLRLLRALMYTAVEVPGGLRPDLRRQLYDIAAAQFPTQDERLNRELSLVLAYSQQPGAIAEILAAMPQGEEQKELQVHYLYGLRAITAGWTLEQKRQLVDVYARASRWRGGVFAAVGQMFDDTMRFFTPDEQQMAYEAVPAFAPLPDVPVQAGRAGGAGAAGGRGAAAPQAALGATGTVPGPGIDKQESFDRLIFRDFQGAGIASGTVGGGIVPPPADPLEPRRMFEAECASCHRFGSVGASAAGGPDLTRHQLTRRELIEAMYWPERRLDPQYQTSVIETSDGRTIQGLVIREDAQTLIVKTADAVQPITVAKSLVRAQRKESTSIMPDFFEKRPPVNVSAIAGFLLQPPPE